MLTYEECIAAFGAGLAEATLRIALEDAASSREVQAA
jgi:hypothetical protein